AREYGPGHPSASFDFLGKFPDELAKVDQRKRTVLFRLFQPKSAGRASFAVAMSALDRTGTDGWLASAARVGVALITNFWFAALLLAGMVWIAADWSLHVACDSHAY